MWSETRKREYFFSSICTESSVSARDEQAIKRTEISDSYAFSFFLVFCGLKIERTREEYERSTEMKAYLFHVSVIGFNRCQSIMLNVRRGNKNNCIHQWDRKTAGAEAGGGRGKQSGSQALWGSQPRPVPPITPRERESPTGVYPIITNHPTGWVHVLVLIWMSRPHSSLFLRQDLPMPKEWRFRRGFEITAPQPISERIRETLQWPAEK